MSRAYNGKFGCFAASAAELFELFANNWIVGNGEELQIFHFRQIPLIVIAGLNETASSSMHPRHPCPLGFQFDGVSEIRIILRVYQRVIVQTSTREMAPRNQLCCKVGNCQKYWYSEMLPHLHSRRFHRLTI